MKNPNWKEIHDEFYEPVRLLAEQDAPPEIRDKPRPVKGLSTKPYRQPKSKQITHIKSKITPQ